MSILLSILIACGGDATETTEVAETTTTETTIVVETTTTDNGHFYFALEPPFNVCKFIPVGSSQSSFNIVEPHLFSSFFIFNSSSWL